MVAIEIFNMFRNYSKICHTQKNKKQKQNKTSLESVVKNECSLYFLHIFPL